MPMEVFRPKPGVRLRANARCSSFYRLAALWLFVLGMSVLAIVPAQAQRRELAASYQISKVVRTGGEVSFDLTLKVINYSGQSLRNAGIVLYGKPVQPAEENPVLGTFPLIKSFPSRAEISLTQSFTVSAAEYAGWGHGNDPRLVFLKPDAQLGTLQEPIDARRDFSPVTVTKAKTAGGVR